MNMEEKAAMILSIETSTKVCSLAIHNNGQLLAHHELHSEKSHSKYITVIADDLLKECGMHAQDLDAIAVSEGPGSYTGLRIGVSTAKGLCYGLDKPMIAVNTLEAMAFGFNKWNTAQNLCCPMIDARRMEVYCGIFNYNNENVVPVEAKIIDENSFSNLLERENLVLFGNGAFKCKGVLKSNNVYILDDFHPSAKYIGELAYKAFGQQKFEDVAYFEPYYLKDFISGGITHGK